MGLVGSTARYKKGEPGFASHGVSCGARRAVASAGPRILRAVGLAIVAAAAARVAQAAVVGAEGLEPPTYAV